MSGLRLIFMGTPKFAVPVLEALVAAGHEVLAVYTQPPRPAGRGKVSRPSAVAEAALELGIEVRTPTSLRDEDEQARFAALRPDAAVVVAYGQILPAPILTVPRLGCINAHASILPRWRGAAPIQRAIMAGDDETGVSVMAMDEGLDTGPVLETHRIPISPDDTAGSLHDKLSRLSARLIPAVLNALADDNLQPQPQPGEGATYAAKIDKAEARIDWNRSAIDIDRQVRALNPSPGAWLEINGERIKLLAGELVEESGPPGEVLDNEGTVACGVGAYKLQNVQRSGRGSMEMAAFLRGYSLPKGTLLGSANSESRPNS